VQDRSVISKRAAAAKAEWGRPLDPDMFPVLSLRQPWAWAVLHAGKRVENRCWSTTFRGEFLIHAAAWPGDVVAMAAKRRPPLPLYDARIEAVAMLDMARDLDAPLPPGKTVTLRELYGQRGGIVGVARPVDVLPPCTYERSLFGNTVCSGPWHVAEQYGFVLEDVRATAFEPLKGSLGFFGVPLDIAQRVLATARAA
jgi:hypothetical protein